MSRLRLTNAPHSTGRHRRPSRKVARSALRLGLATALAGGGVVVLADPVAAAVEVPCQPQGQQIQCSTSDSSRPYQFTAPADLTAEIDIRGGDGGRGGVEEFSADRSFVRAQDEGPSGGTGGFTSVSVSLNRGDVLTVYIGGPGGNGTSCHGGAGGRSGGITTGGEGGDADHNSGCTTETAGGGGGGGATFVLTGSDTAITGTPVAIAGGGGGGAGSGGPEIPAVGGRGGGNQSGISQPGQPPGRGGASGDQKSSGSRIGGNGADAGSGDGCGGGGYRATSIDSTDPCDYGGGGGGGGLIGGDGGDPGGGGGGGKGFPATSASMQRTPAAFHAAQVGGNFTVTYNQIPANPGGGHHNGNGNDPNPNTNPAVPSSRAVSNTVTAICNPRVGVCTVRPPAGPDSQFAVTARGGSSRATLFGTLMGGSRPDCPNYNEINSDWVSFGFLKSQAGSSWVKTAKLTTRHKLSHDAAVALSKKMQICFEAPYRFGTRPGYELGGHNSVFDGVLPDCAAVGSSERGVARPCVASRQILSRHGGWVVRFTFRVPANSRDPKALG